MGGKPLEIVEDYESLKNTKGIIFDYTTPADTT
jgi:hypothetical protein